MSIKKAVSLVVLLLLSVASFATDSSHIQNNGVQITLAAGWNESLYAEWQQTEGADSYHVYVKGGQYNSYTRIDDQLIRSYGHYNRADVPGLKAANDYAVRIIPVRDGQEDESLASTATDITVCNFNRDGYAHHQATAGIGAYNDDGTLKDGARILYISKDNAKTVTLSMMVDQKGKTETRTGIQDILKAYEKGAETRPLAIRIIGLLKKEDMPVLGSSAIGLQVKGKGQQMNLTLEGVGNDATLHGFGVLVRNCRYVELRNFAVMMHPEDGISFDTNNEHLWGHHLDIFYGQNKGGDKAKGDGSFDVKGTKYATISAVHYWDSGKCNLNSNGDEVEYVTYHHNWFDHSDSRHPRVRKSQHLHVFNNYYDGNSKYGVGATTGSCIFVEKNYFRNCKYPMLISMQGSDVHNGIGSSSDTKGTFSKEDGGMIKAFGNYMTGQKSFEPYTADDATFSRHFDAYAAENRSDQVPAEVTTLQGGTGYNNFDTADDFYTYTPDDASDVPAIVTGQYGAGRCQKGDFQYTFDNTTQDTNDGVITDLSNQLANYTSSLVKIYGDMGSTTAIHHPSSINHLPSSIFHLSGQRVDENYKGIVIRDGRKIKQ
jgi:pectate lyase